MKIFFLFSSILFFYDFYLYGQEIENTYQARTSVQFSKQLINNLKIKLSPELRWNGSNLDKFLLSSEIKYQPFDFLSVATGYRLTANKRDEKKTEYLNRFMLNTIFEKKINRWQPGLRLCYTNISDDDENEIFLRYKAFLSYDIKKCKLKPELSYEIFQPINTGDIYKLRYGLSLDYKMSKNFSLTGTYKLDYYMKIYRNRHIFDFGLKLKF